MRARLSLRLSGRSRSYRCASRNGVPYGALQVELLSPDGSSKKRSGRELPWLQDTFIKLTGIRPGDTVIIAFPMIERVTTERAVNLEYRTQWLGDDVVGIDPRGTYYPLYSGKKVYRKAPMKERTLRVETDRSLD